MNLKQLISQIAEENNLLYKDATSVTFDGVYIGTKPGDKSDILKSYIDVCWHKAKPNIVYMQMYVNQQSTNINIVSNIYIDFIDKLTYTIMRFKNEQAKLVG